MNRNVAVHGIDLNSKRGPTAIVLGRLHAKGLVAVSLEKASNYVLCLGVPAYQAVTGMLEPLDEVRGKILLSQTGDRLAWATFHPGVVLRRRELLPLWQDDIQSFVELVKLDLTGR